MQLPTVIYLRGAGRSQQVWDAVLYALADHPVVRDRTAAWHLARGGCPLIAVDMSAAAGITPPNGRPVTVSQVVARYGEDSLGERLDLKPRGPERSVDCLWTAADVARAVRELVDACAPPIRH
jgi:hypothetical protein